jgi:hypothetical protein
MGSVYLGLPIPIVRAFIEKIKFYTFIESGTFHGDSSLWASKFFSEVYTIEASKSLYDEYHDKLSKGNITHIFGDSRRILQKLIESSKPYRLIWLDAHWIGDEVSYGKGDEIPVVGELQAIPKKTRNNFILIDDARYFLSPNIPSPHNFKKWPNIGEIITLLGEIQEIESVFILDDVIISPPRGLEDITRDVLHALFEKNYEKKISVILKDFNRFLHDLLS